MIGSEATGELEAEETEASLEAPSDAVDKGVALGALVEDEMTLEALLADVELESPCYKKKDN